MTGGGEAEASLASCSGQSCGCLCHLQRPGMMLIWVPVEVDSAGEKKNHVKKQTPKDAKNGKKTEEAEQGGNVDGKNKDEAESASVKEKLGTKPKKTDYQDCLPSKDEASSPPVKEKLGTKTKKSDFHEQLNGLLANHHSHRISEPASQATNNYYESSLLKPAPSPPAVREPPSQDEEENIYEVHLPVPELFPKKPLVINDVLKFSESNTIASVAPVVVDPRQGLDDTPPPRPPKTHSLMGSLPPPCRPPPPPPVSPSSKRDPRRLSNISLNQAGLSSTNVFMFPALMKTKTSPVFLFLFNLTGEENGGMEEREDREP